MTQLTITKPIYGWANLSLNGDEFYISYNTNFGYEILNAAYKNFQDHNSFQTILLNSEGDGTYYLIFDAGQLTICWTGDNYCKHYFFGSAKELLRQVCRSISLYPKEWDLFYESEGACVSSLLDQIKENCPEVIK